MDIVLYVLSIGAPLFVLRFPGESGLGSVEQDFVKKITTNKATSSLNRLPRAQYLLAVVLLPACSEPSHGHSWSATRC